MAAFEGNARFSVRRLLGTGGMGAVYEAHDADTGQVVALKTILRAEESAWYRLEERRFRSSPTLGIPTWFLFLNCSLKKTDASSPWNWLMVKISSPTPRKRAASVARTGNTETLTLVQTPRGAGLSGSSSNPENQEPSVAYESVSMRIS